MIDLFDVAGFGVDKCDTTGAPPAKKMRASADNQFQGDRAFVDPAGVYFLNTEFEPNASVTAYLTAYDKDFDYAGDAKKKLVAVDGHKIDFTFDSKGDYSGLSMSEIKKGNYNLIIDTNKDGYYQYGIDAVDKINEIGFAVLDSYPAHSNIVDLDDNANQREDYNADIARNVYVLAHNLPVQNRDVDLYVISERLLKVNNPGWTTWDDASNVDLKESEAPVYNKKATHSVWVYGHAVLAHRHMPVYNR